MKARGLASLCSRADVRHSELVNTFVNVFVVLIIYAAVVAKVRDCAHSGHALSHPLHGKRLEHNMVAYLVHIAK